jgi:two-component system NarL family sensor kinase
MKRLIKLLIFAPTIGFAQQRNPVDSLKALLINAKADTVRVKLLNSLADKLAQDRAKEGFKYTEEAIALSKKLNFKKGLGKAYYHHADMFISTNGIDSAQIYLQKSIDVFTDLKDARELAYSYNTLGWLTGRQGKQINAISYFRKAADIYEKIGDLMGTSNCLVLIASNYTQLHEYDKALAYYQKAYAIRVKLNEMVWAAKTLAGMGIIYRSKHTAKQGDKNFNLAIQYMQKARSVFDGYKEDFNLALIDKEIGVTYFQQANYATALRYLLNAEVGFKKLGAKRELGALCNAIGLCYFELKQLPVAKIYLEKGLTAATAEKHQEHIADSYNALYRYYKLTGNSALALSNHEKWLAQKDSMDVIANFDKLAEVTRKYETEKKEQEIKLLNKENTIQRLSIARQKTTLGIVGASSIALLAFGGLLYNRNKNKQKILMQEQQLAQRAELTNAVIEAEEKERTRIASDLHDGVGQLFSAVKMNLNGLFERVDMPRDEDRFLAEKTLALVEESCKEVRYISHQMMPNMLLKSGIASDVKSFIEKIDSEKLKVRVEANGFKDKLESNVEIVLYRVIQEAVNNVIKHARASLLDIKLNRDASGISASITDNGVGFDTTKVESSGGIGLKNIAARVEYLKGTVDYRSAPGAGTSLRVWVPVS